jgi:hypothetical protein
MGDKAEIRVTLGKLSHQGEERLKGELGGVGDEEAGVGVPCRIVGKAPVLVDCHIAQYASRASIRGRVTLHDDARHAGGGRQG